VFNVARHRPLFIALAPLLSVVAVVGLGAAVDSYWQYVLGMSLSAMLVGSALVMLTGYARCITLATGSIMAIGAYASAILTVKSGMPFAAAVIAGAIMGGAGGFLMALPSVRFRSHNLAMVTLVFQEVVIILLREWKSVTGGAEGLNVPAPHLFGVTISNDFIFLIVLAVGTSVGLLPLSILLQGAFGKNLRAMACSEVAARAYGINVKRNLIAAFTISSFAIALASALMAPRLRIIDPDSFGILPSIFALAYPIVGGTTSIWGGILGGGLLRAMPEILRPIADYIELGEALLVIGIVLFLPGGIIELFNRLHKIVTRGHFVKAGKLPDFISSERPPERGKLCSGENVAWAARIEELSVRYGALKAVDQVSLNVRQGTIHGLMGANGAGKTTLFNAVSGFIKPSGGSISVFGEALDGLLIEDRIRLGVTRTFQNVAIFSGLTCLENVKIGLGRNDIGTALARSVHGTFDTIRAREESETAMRALHSVGLSAYAYVRSELLSLGNQRRLELARAIVSNPKLLLLDEPVSGVAEEEVSKIHELLRRINRDHGITMLIVEHNIGFLASLCDRLTVLNHGRVVAEGEPKATVSLPLVRDIYFGEALVA